MKSKKNTPESGDIRGWAKLAKEKPTEEVDKLLKEDERRYNRGKNGKFFGKNGHYDEDGSEDEERGDEWDETIEEGKEEKKECRKYDCPNRSCDHVSEEQSIP